MWWVCCASLQAPHVNYMKSSFSKAAQTSIRIADQRLADGSSDKFLAEENWTLCPTDYHFLI